MLRACREALECEATSGDGQASATASGADRLERIEQLLEQLVAKLGS